MVTKTEDIASETGEEDNGEGERDDAKDEESGIKESSKPDEDETSTLEVLLVDRNDITGVGDSADR